MFNVCDQISQWDIFFIQIKMGWMAKYVCPQSAFNSTFLPFSQLVVGM